MEREHKSAAVHLILSCWLTYTLSICLKMAYGASMTAVKEEYLIGSDMLVGLPITLYYLTYAMIQFVLAAFIGKIDLKRYLLVTCLPGGLLFVSVFFYSPFWYVNVVMALEGVLLGAVWCGCMQLFRRLVPSTMLGRAILFMGAGFSAGSALSFGVSALAMKLQNWRIGFLTIGAAFSLALIYMLFSVRRAEAVGLSAGEPVAGAKKPTWRIARVSARPLVVMAISATVLQGLLYYGFSNWMPTILKSNFDLAKERATLISMLLPIVTYAGPVLAQIVCNKLKNDFATTALLASFTMTLSLVLSYVYHLHLALTVAVIVAACVFLRSVSMMFGSLIPVHAGAYINTGSSVAVINASACVAAAASPLLVGAILDATGRNWFLCFLFLFGLAVVMTAIPAAFAVADKIRQKEQTANDNVEHHA